MRSAYTETLETFVTGGVAFAVIGTWALRKYFPEAMRDYVVHDCDLVLRPTDANLRLTVRILKQRGWTVTVWEAEVTEEVRLEDLAGKFYLRARWGELTLDATFECPIPWELMAEGIRWREGLPLAAVDDILALKRRKAMEAGSIEDTEALIRRILDIGK